MADVGALYVRILSDVKAFGADLKAKMTGAAGDAEQSGKKVGGSFAKGMAAATAALASVAVVKYLGDAGKAASELQADMHKTEAVFGTAGESVLGWSKKSASALGMSQDKALTLANNLGNLYKSYGLTGKGAAQLAEQSINLGNDLATFYKKDPAAGVNAIRMATAGAYRGLRQFGIVIDKNAVTAQALSMHLGKTTVDTAKLASAQGTAQKALITYNDAVKAHGKTSSQAQKALIGVNKAQAQVNKVVTGGKTVLTAAEKAQATYALVSKKAGAAQGAFAKEGNTLEVQQRKTAAQFANMKAQLGTALLPIFTKVGNIIATKVAPAFASMAGWLAKNSGWLTPLVGTLTAFALAIFAVNKAIKLYKAAQDAWIAVSKLSVVWQKAMTVGQWLLNAAMDANPVMLIVIAIAALIAILVVAYLKVGWFRNAVQVAFAAVVAAAKWVWNIIVVAFHAVVNAISWAINWVRHNWPLIVAVLMGPIGIVTLLIVKNWQAIWNFTKAAWNGLLAVVRAVAGAIVGFVSGLVGRVVGFFAGLPGRLIGYGSSMMHGFLDGIAAGWNAVAGFLSGIGTRALRAVGDLARALYNVGRDLINGFIQGIKDAWSSVTSTLTGLASHLPGFIKGPLHIGSPSRVMADEVGQWISKGVAAGITKHAGAVQSAMAGLPLSVYGAGAAGAGAGVRSAPTVGTMYVQALNARQLAGAVADRLAYEELRAARL